MCCPNEAAHRLLLPWRSSHCTNARRDAMVRGPSIMPTVPLTEGTVLLRLPDERDSAAVYAYGQDPDIEETAWLPIPVPCPPEDAAGIVQEFQQGWHSRFGLTLVITTPPD